MFFRRSPKKEIKEDLELLALYKETGEITYLGELFDRYVHLIFAVCYKYLKNKEDSQDLTMQVFEKLRIELKKQEVKNFKSWLHVLTKNECLMLLRKSSYKDSKGNLEINVDSDMESVYFLNHSDEGPSLEENLKDLENGIISLPQGQRECIRLFYIQEKCYKEIVDITGFELNKVKSYIQNGKRNLKIYLQKINDEL